MFDYKFIDLLVERICREKLEKTNIEHVSINEISIKKLTDILIILIIED